MQDIQMWRQDPQPAELAFLVSASKRQKTEVKLSNLTPAERKLFDEAKAKEIQSWLDTQTVCRILRHKIPQQNNLKCRWILTWKNADDNTHLSADSKNVPSRKAKARLVILGYQDPELSNLERDSPTLSKLSRNLLLQICVSNRWEIGSFDIKTAFLRGRADSRMLGLEPPEELRAKLGLRPNEVCQLLKGAYGLVNAPLLWFRELSKALINLGFQPAPFDPCSFILFDENNKTRGFMVFMSMMVSLLGIQCSIEKSTSWKTSFHLEAARNKILSLLVYKSTNMKIFRSMLTRLSMSKT